MTSKFAFQVKLRVKRLPTAMYIEVNKSLTVDFNGPRHKLYSWLKVNKSRKLLVTLTGELLLLPFYFNIFCLDQIE